MGGLLSQAEIISRISARAWGRVVALGFVYLVLGAVLVSQRIAFFELSIVRQKALDGADDAGETYDTP
jgi:hypothetical protein